MVIATIRAKSDAMMHCKNGHDLTDPTNVMPRAKNGRCVCRQCDRDAGARYRKSDRAREKARERMARYRARARA